MDSKNGRKKQEPHFIGALPTGRYLQSINLIINPINNPVKISVKKCNFYTKN